MAGVLGLIKRTAVRRVVWIVVGVAVYAALSFVGIAHAQVKQCTSVAMQCTAAEALAWLEVVTASRASDPYLCPTGYTFSGWGPTEHVPANQLFRSRGLCVSPHGAELSVLANSFHGSTLCAVGEGEWRDDLMQCHAGCNSQTNTDRPPFAPVGVLVPNGTAQCSSDGCVRLHHLNPDTGFWLGTPTGDFCVPNAPPDCSAGVLGRLGYVAGPAGCSPPPQECQPGQTQDPSTGECQSSCPAGQSLNARNECVAEEDTCPVGQIRSPAGTCLPGEGSCAAGEARGADGTCKRDSDGDGTPDEEEEEGDSDNKDGSRFSGGDDCRVPPTCSGDAVMCGQARIQWRIDCNTRRNVNVAGGSCAAMPTCSGEKCDALEMAQLMQQWKTACALEKLVAGEGDGAGGQPLWTRVDGMGQDPGAGEGEGDAPRVREGAVIDGSNLDQSGFTGGGSCSGFNIAGDGIFAGLAQSLNVPPSFWCQGIDWFKVIFVLLNMIGAIFFLASAGRVS